ncbi:cell division protein FtsH [Candidatus Campbellbacteria bacterium RIFCSPHIGHO2_12_FULL_35_10]|uniref:ATP-dependent zinc metalloprotease FtsH n=1 Tax=Candidatus Campbellbacteria bacterium RIFCSPHIGHO2_12_FULL_35_10 TaxID=1797578 RepID=A0A1F5ER67_9BACT|nr:MAG: cell division protein FtsH [Candidatus Campbellbacteria bacterium RIFCSPHIGHO2_12_FULL_35_10]
MQFFNNFLTAILILFLVLSVYSYVSEKNSVIEDVTISNLVSSIKAGEVKEINVEGDKLKIILNNGKEQVSKKEVESSLSETFTNYGVTAEQLNAVNIEVNNPTGLTFWLVNLAPFLLPLFFIIFLVWFMTRQVKGAGMQAFSFGQSKARIIDPKDKKQRITFADVAGVKEAKEELVEIVDFLKNPKKFLDIGAQIPKGLILMGAPGTGKTLLAKAVAGEAGVPFFSISGSEFVEMFVGVGASRVRDLFKMAKQSAPAIIFIDEIDAVGRVRGSGMGGGNDEREQTLNQILVEMDGFEPNEKVIVIAATNRPDVLDPALLRTGRFDRRVVVDLPDRKDREEILKIHSRKKPFAEDVNLVVIAERTPGFSGADLYSLMNEGAILAAREDRQKVSQYDLIRSIEKVMLGPERKSHILSKKEKEITAYHEVGHALVSSVLEHSDPVHKISIISRGRAAGYTLKLPLTERKLHNKKEFLDDIAMTLGGYAAEKLIFGDITTGPSNDLQVATAMARNMVMKYGMSDEIGPVALGDQGGKIMFGGADLSNKEYSEKTAFAVDNEVSRIIQEGLVRAEKVLNEHRKALDNLSKKLIESETIEREEFDNLLIANNIMPKKEEQI